MNTPTRSQLLDEYENVDIELLEEPMEEEQEFYDDEENIIEGQLVANVLLDELESEPFDDDCLEHYQEDLDYEENNIY